jgi:hypothetical protein
MKITNKTMQYRSILLGLSTLKLQPLETITVPDVLVDAAKKAVQSEYWQKLIDAGIFAVDSKEVVTEETATHVESPEAPKELKQKKGKRLKNVNLDITGTVSV